MYVPVPREIINIEDQFIKNYKAIHGEKKKLVFNYSHASWVINTLYLRQPLSIETNQIIGSILLSFNSSEEVRETPELTAYFEIL